MLRGLRQHLGGRGGRHAQLGQWRPLPRAPWAEGRRARVRPRPLGWTAGKGRHETVELLSVVAPEVRQEVPLEGTEQLCMQLLHGLRGPVAVQPPRAADSAGKPPAERRLRVGAAPSTHDARRTASFG